VPDSSEHPCGLPGQPRKDQDLNYLGLQQAEWHRYTDLPGTGTGYGRADGPIGARPEGDLYTLACAGYRVKVLDGNSIEATHHRIEPLRGIGAGALPGKSLLIYEPQWEMATDVFPCEDGHAQERSLLGAVLPTVQRRDLLIMDRNFCVRDFLHGIAGQSAYFICRQHQRLPWEEDGEERFIGRVPSEAVYEQHINVVGPLLFSEATRPRAVGLAAHRDCPRAASQAALPLPALPNPYGCPGSAPRIAIGTSRVRIGVEAPPRNDHPPFARNRRPPLSMK
jgi:hypothetical protein